MENFNLEELSKQITVLQKQLINVNQKGINQIKPKRQEGSYELLKNGKARLYYMKDRISYRDTVEAKDDDEAKKQLTLFVDKVKKGLFINTNYTFAEWAQIWLDKKVRPNSDAHICPQKYINYLNNRIIPVFGNKKITNIKRLEIETFFNTLKNSKTMYKNRENKTIKPGTVEKIRKIVNGIFNYALEQDIILKNPCKGIKIKYENASENLDYIKYKAKQKISKIDYFNIEEYKHVCKLLENEFLFYYNNKEINSDKKLRQVGRRFIALLALKTGMRRSELFGLARGEGFYDLNDIDCTFFVNKTRHYAKGVGKYTGATKNDSSIRKKHLANSLLPFLKDYYKLLDELNYNNIFIFDHLSIDGVCSWWNDWLKNNNIRDIRWHDIRHTVPTVMLTLGVDLKTISEFLGHSDISETFNTYGKVLKELDIDASSKIDTL